MCDVDICLICLRSGLKMCKYDQQNLLAYYEDIVARKVTNCDSLPCQFCFECAAMLHKFNRFKQKCKRGHDLLQDLCWSYGVITNDVINTLDLKTLDITPVNVVSQIELVDINPEICECKNKSDQSKTHKESKNPSPNEAIELIENKEDNFKLKTKDVFTLEGTETSENVDAIIGKDIRALDSKVTNKNPILHKGDINTIKSKTKNAKPRKRTYKESIKTGNSLRENEKIPEFKSVIINAENDVVKELVKVEVGDEKIEFLEEGNESLDEYYQSEDEIYLSSIKQAAKDVIKIEEPKYSDNENEQICKIDEIQQTSKNSDDIHSEKPISFDENIDDTQFDDIADDGLRLVLKAKTQLKRRKIEAIKNQKFVVNKKKERKHLDQSLWKMYDLTEDDALAEFHALATDPKFLSAEHKCDLCYQWFRTKDKIKRHMILSHNEKLKYECLVCHYRFQINCVRGKHLQLHYKRYECLKCGLRTRSLQSAQLHQDMHIGTTLKCKHCDEVFRHLSTYYTHLRTLRSDHVCNRCGMSFVSRMGLYQHTKLKHVGETEIEADKCEDPDRSVKSFCDKCNINFETRQAYEEHVLQSSVHDADDENEVMYLLSEPRKKMLEFRRKPVVRRPHKKYIDDYGHNSKEKRVPAKEKPTDCDFCGEKFPSPAKCFKHHIKSHPDVPYPTNERVICELCGISLAPANLDPHKINKHSRAQYSCDTCARAFHVKAALKRHMLVHTGEKPYPCSVCDKRFTQKGSMLLHYNTFHLKQPYPKRNRRKYPPKEVGIGMDRASTSSEHSQQCSQ